MTNPYTLKRDLDCFIGTEFWHRHSLNRNVLFTDGVKYFADQVGGYWLLDIIATQPEILSTMRDGFATIELDVNNDATGEVICDDGNGNLSYRRTLEYTDAPEGTWRFFFANSVIMLPSEY